MAKSFRSAIIILMLFVPAILIGCGNDPDHPKVYNINFNPDGKVPVNTEVHVTAEVEGSNLTYLWKVSGGLLREVQTHHAQQTNSPLVGVTSPGHDNFGMIMTDLGYTGSSFPLSGLKNRTALDLFNIILINSSDEISVTGDEGPLRSWVNDGGILYLSGNGSEFLNKLAPGKITFPKPESMVGKINPGTESISSTVKDSKAYMALGYHFFGFRYPDFAWSPVISTASDVTSIIVADASKVVDSDDIENLPVGHTFMNTPIALTFRYGKGLVVYSSLYYHSNLTNDEKRVLYYLGSLLIAHSLRDTSHTLIDLTSYYPDQDYAGFLDKEREITWLYDSSDKDDIMVVANAPRGILNLTVEGPDDYTNQLTASPPITMTIPKAEKGVWEIKLNANSTGTAEILPCLVSVGSRSVHQQYITTVPEIIWRTPMIPDTYMITLKIIDDQSRTYELTQGLIVR